LKVYRKLCSKNKRSFIVYIPCEWVNGYNAGRVSLQLCEILPEGHAGVLIDLLDSGQVKK